MKKVAVWMVIVLSAISTGCSKEEPYNALEQDPPVTVGYVRIDSKPVELKFQLPGRVTASVVSEVRPQVDGIIRERCFREGEYVRKEQALYKIDDARHRAAVAAAEASLAEAQANLTELVSREKRQRPLVKIHAVSPMDYDQLISLVNQARAKVQKLEADLKSAEIDLAYTTVKAPVSGWIGVSEATVGALVTTNQSSALATIRQVDSVYVDLTQPSLDMLRYQKELANGGINRKSDPKLYLKLEDDSIYSRLTDSQPIEGRVLLSETQVNATTGSVRLRAVFSNPDRVLLPGMYVTGLLTVGQLNNVLLVPQRAVMMSGDGAHFVFVLEQNATPGRYTAKRRIVQIDRAEGSSWLIRNGVRVGDLVVVDGLQKVKTGEQVCAQPYEALPHDKSQNAKDEGAQ